MDTFFLEADPPKPEPKPVPKSTGSLQDRTSTAKNEFHFVKIFDKETGELHCEASAYCTSHEESVEHAKKTWNNVNMWRIE